MILRKRHSVGEQVHEENVAMGLDILNYEAAAEKCVFDGDPKASREAMVMDIARETSELFTLRASFGKGFGHCQYALG